MKLTYRFILCSCLIICVSFYSVAQEHPHILVKNKDKQNIIDKIDQHEWAKSLFSKLVNKIDPIANRHDSLPDWILSRYQMYRIPGKHYTDFYTDEQGTALIRMEGNAPVPTVRGSTHKRPPLDPEGFGFISPKLEDFPVNDTLKMMYLQSKAPSGKWYWTDPQRVIDHINKTVNTVCLEASILYWLTDNDKYAKLAADILNQWVVGAYHQNPYQGACRDGYFTVESLGDLAYSVLPLAFDFTHGYLEANGAPMKKYDSIFSRLARTQLERGFWQNNWFAAQSPTYLYSALAISDKEEKDKYLHYFMYEDKTNGKCGRISLKTTCERWLTPDGHWKEPGGYHNFPVGNILRASVAAENNGYAVFEEFPPLFQASYALMKYLFPNNKVMTFGDTRRESIDPNHLEIAISMAIKYDDPILPTLVNVMKKMINEGYKRENSGWFGLLNNIGELPEVDIENIELPRTGTLDFAKCFLQRNGVDKTNGLMCYVQGATYNHNHCNGIAMELYGQGIVLGNDPGIGGTYDTQIHKDYYALYAAHNTVIAGGKSRPTSPFKGSGGKKPMGESELNTMEPLPDKSAVSPYCSFTSVNYLEPSTKTKQKRSLALIRTSETNGYYVDIFHSDNEIKNEYLYHNLGHSIKMFDPKNTSISMSPTNELSEHEDGYGPGYNQFKEKLTSGAYSENIKTQFQLKVKNDEDIFMDMHIGGGAEREYFTAMAPKSYTAPAEYKLLPVPVAVIRQNGSAWKKPFMVVYESYQGEGNFSIQSMNSSSNGETSVINVAGTDSKQTIIQSFSDKPYQHHKDDFKGHFGVISKKKNQLHYLYLGEGTNISSGNHSIASKDNSDMNANLEIEGDHFIVSSNQVAYIGLPSGKNETIILEAQGKRTELSVDKSQVGIWYIEIPAILKGKIYREN
jgi:hypothetical protein